MFEEVVTKSIIEARNTYIYEEIDECDKEAKTTIKYAIIKLKKVSNMQGK